jgi:hypothetical protein
VVRTMRAVAWPLLLLLLPLVSEVGGAAIARGPLSDAAPRFPQMGWVTDHARTLAPSVVAGVLTVQGDTRVYLVQDYTKREWEDHHYMRFDLKAKPLEFTLDLSNVPCGCLACVYLVAMKDPDRDGPNYWCVHRAPEKAECSTSAAREEPVAPLTLTSAVDPPPCARSDMAENVLPGFEEGTCTELDLVCLRCGAPPCVPLSATRTQYPVTSTQYPVDLHAHSLNPDALWNLLQLEANNNAMQTAIHTETGNAGFGSGVCDRNGCFARVGGPQSPRSMQGHYGPGKTIDSMRPFRVTTRVDEAGAMSIVLGQNGNSVTSFDRRIAGGLRRRT